MRDREQLELIIKTTHEKLVELTDNNEKQSIKILELQT